MNNIDVGHIIKQLGGVAEVKRKLKVVCNQDISYKGVQKWRERNTLGRDGVTTLLNLQQIARTEDVELELEA